MPFGKGCILHDNLYIAVARLVRCCQWAATILFLGCIYIAVDKGIFFEPFGRALIILITLLPPALFLVGLYFYESQDYRLHGMRQQALISFAVFFALASPAISINWRYTAFPLKSAFEFFLYIAGIILFLNSVLPIGSKPDSDNVVISLLLHYKRVMHDAWKIGTFSNVEENLNVEVTERIKTDRTPFYFQRANDLLAFQKTLTCPELDATMVAEYLKPNLKKRKKTTVVDIGGGEGRFTAQLLMSLTNLQVSSLLDLDPATSIHDTYLATIVQKTALQRDLVAFDGHGVEGEMIPKCDLLIASHSLYAIFDKARSSNDGDVEGELRKLLNSLNAGGRMILIMSSKNSLAIHAKRSIYHKVFGSHRFDTVAEDIEPFLIKYACVEKQLQSDSLINMTDLLQGFAKSRKVPPEFVNWASYFLRCDLKEMPPSHIEAIARLFLESSFKLPELAESVQHDALAVPEHGLRVDSLVLPHKSMIYILNPLRTR